MFNISVGLENRHAAILGAIVFLTQFCLQGIQYSFHVCNLAPPEYAGLKAKLALMHMIAFILQSSTLDW